MEKPAGRDLEWSLTFQARPRGAKTESFGSSFGIREVPTLAPADFTRSGEEDGR